jgi:hypothetical protein
VSTIKKIGKGANVTEQQGMGVKGQVFGMKKQNLVCFVKTAISSNFELSSLTLAPPPLSPMKPHLQPNSVIETVSTFGC